MIKINPLPPLEYLNECFELDSSLEGGLRWKERPRSHFKKDRDHRQFLTLYANKKAGKKEKQYYTVGFVYNGANFKTRNHRIIYALFNKTVEITDFLVDHIDRNAFNNSPENLRLASNTENCVNAKTPRTNKSGRKGVQWSKGKNKWQVSISINKKKHHLGTFVCIEDAIKCRKEAEDTLFSFYFKGISDEERAIISPSPISKSRRIDFPSVDYMRDLIEKMPPYKIAEIYGASTPAVRKFCIRNDIPCKPRGFWQKSENVVLF